MSIVGDFFTAGTAGFLVDGRTFLHRKDYNASPDRLGLEMLSFARGVASEEDGLLELAGNATVLFRRDHVEPVTETDMVRWGMALNLRSGASWGGIAKSLSFTKFYGAGVLVSGEALFVSPTLNQWSYIIDVDRETLDVYRGQQLVPHDRGLIHRIDPEDIGDGVKVYPAKRIASWYLEALPSNDRFLNTVHSE